MKFNIFWPISFILLLGHFLLELPRASLCQCVDVENDEQGIGERLEKSHVPTGAGECIIVATGMATDKRQKGMCKSNKLMFGKKSHQKYVGGK